MPEAKTILKEELEKRSCGRWTTYLSIMLCGAVAETLYKLDPADDASGEIPVRCVDAFLADPSPPSYGGQDSEGHIQYTAEYRDWSRRNGHSPDESVVRESYFGALLRGLAIRVDPELRPLFRRAVTSNSYAIAVGGVFGLALLGDKEALPSILASAKRQKPLGMMPYYMMLGELRHYDDANVDRLIRAKIFDEEMRESIMSMPVFRLPRKTRP